MSKIRGTYNWWCIRVPPSNERNEQNQPVTKYRHHKFNKLTPKPSIQPVVSHVSAQVHRRFDATNPKCSKCEWQESSCQVFAE